MGDGGRIGDESVTAAGFCARCEDVTVSAGAAVVDCKEVDNDLPWSVTLITTPFPIWFQSVLDLCDVNRLTD